MSSTNRGGKRHPSDFYRTEPFATRRFIEGTQLPGGVWYEPSAGDGAIIRVVQTMRRDVQWVASDIRKACAKPLAQLVGADHFEITDFLKVEPVKVDVIVTNPPFSLAEEFLHHALRFAPWVSFLLRLDFLGTVDRSEFLRKNMPTTYILPNRPTFGLNKKGKVGHDSNEYAWFVWGPWRGRTFGYTKILAVTSKEERKRDREELAALKKGNKLPPRLVEEIKEVVAEGQAVEAVEVGNKRDEIAAAEEIVNATETAKVIESAIATETEASSKEHDPMAFLPAGFGNDVANAEATIARHILKEGSYVFLHRQIFTRAVRNKGDAVLVEHKIIEAAPLVAGVEPSPVGTIWSLFLPKYGEAAQMLFSNLKSYLLGILGLNEKQVTKEMIAQAFDRMGGPEQACCGMLVRGTTYKTEKKDGDDFIGVNWSPYIGENVIGSPSVNQRRAEVMAELGNKLGGNEAAGQHQAQQTQAPATGLVTPFGAPATPAGVQLPNTTVQTIPGAAPAIPGLAAPAVPQVPPAPAQGPAQKLAAAIAAGWQKHPQNPAYYWHPQLPAGQNVKTEAEIIA